MVKFNKYKIFESNNVNCPWFDNGECTGQVTYNQHVNDPRYPDCGMYTCPIFYWIEVLIDDFDNTEGGDA